ncbi:dUTPase [Listeria booriae]|uniref:dUTP diphosphatase n=1 Tax=Listeria booriae TaxID=1552123 RepID=UPI001627A761|nr:dUTP diphosphatase [Listeria booriae]MBC1229785.1 dUTPase [Listeria booriae]MBC1233134.1 dUTPase [Listeria booriae]
MNLVKMLAAQNDFDQQVIASHGIQWTDEQYFRNTLVALDIELSEFANEAQWFKVWKKDKQINQEKLLEEYIDVLHFMLSIANQLNFKDHTKIHYNAIEKLRASGFEGGLNAVYLELKHDLLIMAEPDDGEPAFMKFTKSEYSFKSAWYLFFAIGMIGFDFTIEQIETAYFEKMNINKERQKNGY